MKLVERGIVGLDDPVDRHLPEMPPKWLGITVRQLLNHTSGVPNFTDKGSSNWAKKLPPAGLLGLVSGQGLHFPAGSKYAYSNSNYVMLGQIAERHYGAGARYRTIFLANRERLKRGPDVIMPCQQLYLPRQRRRGA